MKRLVDYVNGLQFVKEQEPVFYSDFHNAIGNILSSDDETIYSMEQREKVLLNSDEIPFIL